MKGTKAKIVGAAAFQLDKTTYNLYNINAGKDLLYSSLGNHNENKYRRLQHDYCWVQV